MKRFARSIFFPFVLFGGFTVVLLLAQNYGTSTVFRLVAPVSGPPSQTCSATSYNGVMGTTSAGLVYQCSNATGSYAWNIMGGNQSSAPIFQITGSVSAPSGAGETFNWDYLGNQETDFINNYGTSSPPTNPEAFAWFNNINGTATSPIMTLTGDGNGSGTSSDTTALTIYQKATSGFFQIAVSNNAGSTAPYFEVGNSGGSFYPLWFAVANNDWMTINPGVSLGFASGGLGTSPNVSLSYVSSGVMGVGNGTVGDASKSMEMASLIPGVLYSAAGTALPTCGSGIKGEQATVSDATSPTYMGAYAGGGAITTAVICSYNGSSYSWLTH